MDLFNISLDDDDEENPGTPAEASEPEGRRTGAGTSTYREPGTARVAQSEEDWQTVKAAYRIKIENGEIWKSVTLPLAERPSKQDAQVILHAVEELYYFKRYAEGAAFARSVLDSQAAKVEELGGLDKGWSDTLRHYELKCLRKATANEQGS